MRVTMKAIAVAVVAAVAVGCCGATMTPRPTEGECGASRTPRPTSTNAAIRVGTCNVRVAAKGDVPAGNGWKDRKADLIALLSRLDMDVFGLQEVHAKPYRELCKGLKEWELVDDHGVSTPVAYRKSRFDLEKKGVFWLSETPDVPRSKGWGADYVRPCLYLILKDKRTGCRLCFVNTHTDHIAVKARVEGMKLIMERMKSFSEGLPVVFVGDHNDGPKSEMTAIARKSLKDARDIAEKKDPGPINTYHAFGRAKPRERLRVDYIYVSDGVRVRDFVTHADKRPGKDLYPTDHYPLSATIELPAGIEKHK